jgi:hypothetical protein
MADEIKINKSITYQNGQLKYTYAPGTISQPQATRGYHDQTVSVTSAEADYAVTVAQPGVCCLRNLEATTTGKTVLWGTTEGLLFRLPPKQDAQFQLATSTGVIAMKNEGALAGTVYVQMLMFER